MGREGGRTPRQQGSPPPCCPPGLLHHKGDKTSFSSRFGQGSIIGVHLDTWHGTLTFFKNRKCIGEGSWDPGGGCHMPAGSVNGPKLSGSKHFRKAVEERSLRVPGSPESGTAQGPSPRLLQDVQVAGLPRSPGFRLCPLLQEWRPPSCGTGSSTRWCAPRRPRAA